MEELEIDIPTIISENIVVSNNETTENAENSDIVAVFLESSSEFMDESEGNSEQQKMNVENMLEDFLKEEQNEKRKIDENDLNLEVATSQGMDENILNEDISGEKQYDRNETNQKEVQVDATMQETGHNSLSQESYSNFFSPILFGE